MKKWDFLDRSISQYIDKYIMDRFFKNTVYVRFKSDYIHMVHIETKKFVEDKPFVLIGKNDNENYDVEAVGKEAEHSDLLTHNRYQLLNAFEHPRSCIGKFELAEVLLRYLLARLMKCRTMVKPIVVMHPLEKTEGGLTDFEKRGLIELGASMGGRKTFFWVGRKLTDQELEMLSFVNDQGSFL